MTRNWFRNASGFSIVEVLITVSIMSVVALGISSMIVNTAKDQRAIQEKFALLEVQNSVLGSFSNPATCMAQLTHGAPMHLNLSPAAIATTAITMSEVRGGILPTSPLLAKVAQPLPGYQGAQMVVSSIQFKDIEPTGNPNEYTGHIEILIDPATQIRPMKPIRVRQIFTAKPDPALTNALLEDCQAPGSVKMGEWETRPTNTAVLSTQDGFLAITSPYNRGLIIQTAKSTAGVCPGAMVMRLKVSARDKYGQGEEQATLPIKAGECFRVYTINVNGNITGEIAQIFFRSIQ